MSKIQQNIKIKQKPSYPQINSFLSTYGCTSSLSFTNKQSRIAKIPAHVKGTPIRKSKIKEIHEQNTRLMAKIMKIQQSKTKRNTNLPQIRSKKMENPEKQRRISTENQRLGRSLIMIKSGKTLERVKTQIAQQIQKLTDPTLTLNMTQNLFFEAELQKVLKGSISTNKSLNKTIDIDSISRRRNRKTEL